MSHISSASEYVRRRNNHGFLYDNVSYCDFQGVSMRRELLPVLEPTIVSTLADIMADGGILDFCETFVDREDFD